MPLKPGLQHDAGAIAPQIERQSEVDQKFRFHLPITAHEELVHFRLRARGNIDAVDFTVVLERRRKQGRFQRTSIARMFHPCAIASTATKEDQSAETT